MVHDFCVWESHRKNREPTLRFREIIIRNKDTGIDNGYYVILQGERARACSRLRGRGAVRRDLLTRSLSSPCRGAQRPSHGEIALRFSPSASARQQLGARPQGPLKNGTRVHPEDSP